MTRIPELIHPTLDALRTPISTLVPHPENARRGDRPTIEASLRAHGQYRPLVVNQLDKTILVGNTTFAVMASHGWTQAAVVWVSVDRDEARRILAVDNRLSDLGENDTSALATLLRTMVDAGRLDATGYTTTEFDALDAALRAPIPTPPTWQDDGSGPVAGLAPPPTGESAPVPTSPALAHQPTGGIHEMQLRLPVALHAQVLADIVALHDPYQTSGVLDTIIEAVRREAALVTGDAL